MRDEGIGADPRSNAAAPAGYRRRRLWTTYARVNKLAEPSGERWMNRRPVGDDPSMAHLMNALSATVLLYAAFTRGGLLVARGLTYIASKAS
jgi:hypothetical protein